MSARTRVVHAINFRIIPPLNTVLMYEGQRYIAVGSMLHTKTDGSQVPLIRWRSHCPTCAEAFECMTTLKAKYPNRRCELHRQVGVPVSTQGGKRHQDYLARNRRRGRKA